MYCIVMYCMPGASDTLRGRDTEDLLLSWDAFVPLLTAVLSICSGCSGCVIRAVPQIFEKAIGHSPVYDDQIRCAPPFLSRIHFRHRGACDPLCTPAQPVTVTCHSKWTVPMQWTQHSQCNAHRVSLVCFVLLPSCRGLVMGLGAGASDATDMKKVEAMYWEIAKTDIVTAAGIMRQLYDKSQGEHPCWYSIYMQYTFNIQYTIYKQYTHYIQ